MQTLQCIFARPLCSGSLLPLAVRIRPSPILGAWQRQTHHRASPRRKSPFHWSPSPICSFRCRVQVLLSSGAHLSRYLVQVAVHHYFRSVCPFIKTPWVRTLSLSTFSHFLKLSSERFGTINTSKGEDDGSVFRHFIRESRLRADRRGLPTDAIAEMLDKGKVSLLSLFECF